jgi:UDPglucose--hexose-1-phosphate uridylyltransferase
VPNLYPATPFHEVVVHTPDHHQRYEDMPTEHRADVLRTYAARLRAAPTPSNVVVWNRGRASGASRTHEHGQIFGLEATPPTLEREHDAFEHAPCVLCGFVEDDAVAIAQINDCRLIAHPVPFVADELLVVPPHAPRLEAVADDGLAAVAEIFAVAIARTLSNLGDGVPFNLVVHTAPSGVDHFHWHAHLMPRTAIWGGLEMGAELPIVASDPHETALRLRSS